MRRDRGGEWGEVGSRAHGGGRGSLPYSLSLWTHTMDDPSWILSFPLSLSSPLLSSLFTYGRVRLELVGSLGCGLRQLIVTATVVREAWEILASMPGRTLSDPRSFPIKSMIPCGLGIDGQSPSCSPLGRQDGRVYSFQLAGQTLCRTGSQLLVSSQPVERRPGTTSTGRLSYMVCLV